MRNLAADKAEMDTEADRRWVTRMRRQHGIRPSEPACWLAYVEQEWFDGGSDRHMVELTRSPGDTLATAACIAGDARQNGTGTWTLEVFGDGVTKPKMLRVYPMLDEDGED